MAKSGLRGIRARFLDATAELARADEEKPDPNAEFPRMLSIGGKLEEVMAGHWPGAPADRLPPDCPVVPIGKDGKLSFFVDSVGQFQSIASKDWSGNTIVDLFALCPNTPDFYWPRWSEGGAKKKAVILGVDVREATKCLVKQAARRGLFDPAERVRGRGAWDVAAGEKHSLLWHAGHALYRVEHGQLLAAAPGEVDGLFYPARPRIMTPWPEPIATDESPAQAIFTALQTWTFERGVFDAVLIVGGLGCMLASGALPFRPHMAFMGDFGVGKTALFNLTQTVLASTLLRTGNTSEAGLRQRLGLDALPVAIDEFEASEDNTRTKAIIDLSRISYDGSRLLRGGADHKGVEFQARSGFFCNGIQLPPMGAADRSRYAIINLGKIDAKHIGKPPSVDAETGRVLLRALMDAWGDFSRVFNNWRDALRPAGLSNRAQDTYGTLFAIAELLLGADVLEAAGIPVTEAGRLGELVAGATAEERGLQGENWRDCFEHMLSVPVDAWKGGEKISIGGVIEQLESSKMELQYAKERIAAAGVGLIEEADAAGKRTLLLAVPQKSPKLERLFDGTRWKQGGWTGALRQGIASGVVLEKPRNVKIDRQQNWCRIVSLAAYDKASA